MQDPKSVVFRDGEDFPSQFRQISSPRAGLGFLVSIAFFACIVLLNIVRDNQLYAAPADSILATLLGLQLLSTDAAFTLLAALLAGYLGYRQFSLSQLPFLSYNGFRSANSTLDKAEGQRFYTVVLRNGGGGPARIRSTKYRVKNVDGTFCYGSDYAAVMHFLGEKGLIEGKDFMLYRLSPGETIRAGGDWLLLEIVESVARRQILALDVAIEVNSVVGGVFSREIYCIPRRWVRQREGAAPEVGGALPTVAESPTEPLTGHPAALTGSLAPPAATAPAGCPTAQ
ncbi:hypothetical protein [Variovorax sp. YR752]|uniref:hypothetical protein n=1 Tax=Variovorax sp. YR752 TaxID=1884383 RepID=UPI003137ECAB